MSKMSQKALVKLFAVTVVYAHYGKIKSHVSITSSTTVYSAAVFMRRSVFMWGSLQLGLCRSI